MNEHDPGFTAYLVVFMAVATCGPGLVAALLTGEVSVFFLVTMLWVSAWVALPVLKDSRKRR
jgi:hypothetical protein